MKEKKNTRKKFLWLGAAMLSTLAASRFWKGQTKATTPPKKETIKMLSQDGKLVEIDKDLLTSGKKISNDELKSWVTRKNSNR